LRSPDDGRGLLVVLGFSNAHGAFFILELDEDEAEGYNMRYDAVLRLRTGTFTSSIFQMRLQIQKTKR
jgi:hypothetical protein